MGDEPSIKGLTGEVPSRDAAQPGGGEQIEALRAEIRCASERLDLARAELQHKDEHIRVIMRELLHRTNNLMAVVVAMAGQTARHCNSFPEFDRAFRARIQSLAKCNRLLARTNWEGPTIEALARSQLASLIEEAPDRICMAGPAVRLRPVATQNIGLALHELAVNSVKFGALSRPEGRISLGWRLLGGDGSDPRAVRIVWEEHGGPPVRGGERKGFGHSVAVRMVESALTAKVEIDMESEGLRWQAEVPAEHIAT